MYALNLSMLYDIVMLTFYC